MTAKPEIELSLQPLEGDVMPVLVVNMGGFTCPPFSFVAIMRGIDGAIRPVKFDSAIDMKPGDRFRFDLRISQDEQLTIRFDKSVELFFQDQPAPNTLIAFPKT
jgi:hypothetical protein